MGLGGQRNAPTALPAGKRPCTREAGQALGRSGRVLNISPPPGFDSRTVQPVASRYIEFAIPAHRRSV